jgi:hypothetical protein
VILRLGRMLPVKDHGIYFYIFGVAVWTVNPGYSIW